MQTEPTAEHTWLQQLVGEWSYQNECVMGPDGKTEKGTGREVVRAFGDLWVMGEMTGTMPGAGEMKGLMALGFDPGKGRFVGSWIGTPMASMFVYEGVLEGNVLTLDCEGPAFDNPAEMAHYQDIVEVRSPNERVLRSQVLDAEGVWHQFMEGVFTRV
jgi:hypothetical protein